MTMEEVVPDNWLEGINDDDKAAEKGVPSVCGGFEPKYNTINLCKRAIAEGIPGDFAEAGVCAGTHPMLMAYVIQRYGGGDRKVHLFDSFSKGFTKERIHHAEDVVRVTPEEAAICEPDGVVMTSIPQVLDNMRRCGIDLGRLVFYNGWVQEVLPKVVDQVPPLAVLRTDVDLYSPTAAVFGYLYDKVSPGGYIISDDWGDYPLDAQAEESRLAVHVFCDKRGIPRPKVNRVISGTVWWKKPV